MKKYYLLFALFFVSLFSFSKNNVIKGIVKEADTHAPIIGANIYWLGTSIGTSTNENGQFSLSKTSEQNLKLVVSFVGFISDTIAIVNDELELMIHLSPNLELAEVLVKKKRAGSYYSTLNTVQTQKVTSAELEKAACCNLSESFETNASVDVAYSDAVTGAKQIKMMGLSGNYVQTINENVSSMRGMASAFGLGYTPGPWMESIQISKGTSSVTNGYEAITGQINVEYKKPHGDEKLHLNLFGNDVSRAEANFIVAHKFNDSLSTMILLHGENMTREIDENSDGFMDMPMIRQLNLMNRWNYKTPNSHRSIDLKILDEQRNSGQVGATKNDVSTGYAIDIATKRYELIAKNGIVFDRPGSSLGIILAASYHNQLSTFGRTNYTGTQYNEYLNFIYQSHIQSDMHKIKIGTSFMADQLTEYLNIETYQHHEYTPGIFGEYNLNIHGVLSVIAGFRADYSSLHGMFYTPRVHAKWNVNDFLTVRSSLGKGYRTAIPLAENSYLLSSSRKLVIDSDIPQEEALNMGGNISLKIPVQDRFFNFMVDFYRTNFTNQVVRDLDTDAHALYLRSLMGKSYSNAFQVELNGEIFQRLSATLAYRFNDVQQTTNGVLQEMPLISRYKGLVSLSYTTRMNKWQFDLTTQLNGGGRMPTPDAVNPLWNETFDSFNVFNAQITKNYRRWSFYLGGENLGNFTMDAPIIDASNPWGNNFDGSMAWGPIHGRTIYLGLRYTLNE